MPLILALLAWLLAAPAHAFPPAAVGLTPYDDDELIAGFVDTVFGAETGESRTANRTVKKFVGPVRLYVSAPGPANPHADRVYGFAADLSRVVDNLQIVRTDSEARADMVVYLTTRRNYARTIRREVWPGVDTTFLERNTCSAVLSSRRSGIERAMIFLVVDEGFMRFWHCTVEELAQSLGPANDSAALTDSIFNDHSTVNTFLVFDWFILNMLYDPRVRPGMTVDEVVPILPAVIADARARLPEVLAPLVDAYHEAAAGQAVR